MRQAICGCGNKRPSSEKAELFGFINRDANSDQAKNICKCGYHACAHDPEYTKNNVEKRTVVQLGRCQGFEARGVMEFDSYYCGCRGWD